MALRREVPLLACLATFAVVVASALLVRLPTETRTDVGLSAGTDAAPSTEADAGQNNPADAPGDSALCARDRSGAPLLNGDPYRALPVRCAGSVGGRPWTLQGSGKAPNVAVALFAGSDFIAGIRHDDKSWSSSLARGEAMAIGRTDAHGTEYVFGIVPRAATAVEIAATDGTNKTVALTEPDGPVRYFVSVTERGEPSPARLRLLRGDSPIQNRASRSDWTPVDTAGFTSIEVEPQMFTEMETN